MASALERLRVVDLSSHLSGPYCAMLLADHGADVVKVERPDSGDDARSMPPFMGGESAPFMIWNRNKRSVVIDLKSEAGKDQLLALIDDADVLIENFRPGTLDRLGLGWKTLSVRNPRLIYAAISGFGQTGPYRERGGFDLITQGMSGLMSVTGPKDGPPHRMPIAISDVAAGMHLAVGVLVALEARHHTGRGQMVETSLLESALSFGVYEAAHVAATGERPPRLGQAHRGSAPYQVFPTADGWITIGGAQKNFWIRLCELIGAPELTQDPRFATNADRVRNNDALVALLEARLRKKPSVHWLKALEAAGIPAGPVLEFDEAMADPHILARGMTVDTQHPAAGKFKTLGIPVKLSDTPGALRRPAPRLGEHTTEVLEPLSARKQKNRHRPAAEQKPRAESIRIPGEQQPMRNATKSLTAAAIIATVSALSASAQQSGVTADSIKIGSFGALTGPGYLYGKLPMNGVEVVFDEVNAAGGIHGRKLQLVREDDRCDPAAAIAAIQKLVHQDQVFALIGGGCSNATFAAREAIETAKIPTVVFASVHDGITTPPAHNIFSTALTATIESQAQLVFAQKQGAKRIAMISMRDAWGRGRYTALMDIIKAKGITLVADEELSPDANDATAQVLRLKAANADAVIMVLYPKPAAVFLRDAQKLAFKPLTIGQSGIADPVAFEEQVGVPGATANFRTISQVQYTPEDPAMDKWRKAIEAKFPGDRLSVYNLFGIG